MALKASNRVWAGAAVAIVAVLVGLSVVFGNGFNHSAAKASAPSALGPDTAQAAPGGPPSTQTADATPPTADPTVSTASAPPGPVISTPVSFQDESLHFKAEIPAGPENDPVLKYLRDDSERVMARIRINARSEYDTAKRKGQSPMAWDVKIKWDYTAKAGGIVSLVGEESEFEGGAHPNLYFDSHIARAATGQQIKFEEMLQTAKSPSPALVVGICEALKGAKLNRIKSATIFDDPIVCTGPAANAKTETAVIALAPSSQADKFGGVYVYYPPYAVGSNAEGAYRLAVQQSVFADDLKPDYKALFAGRAPELN